MKKLVLLFSLFSCSLIAQDTIRFRNGEVKAVKVNEITDTEIKFNRFDNLTGPAYVAEVNEVKSIRYKNGSVDTFTITKAKSEPETPVYVDNVPAEKSFEKIEIRGKTLKYKGRNINNAALFELIQNYPDKDKKNILMQEFNLAKKYKKNHGTGLAMLFGGMLFSMISLGADAPAGSVGFTLGTGASIFGAVIANMNRNKHNAQRVKVARMYNNENYDFR